MTASAKALYEGLDNLGNACTRFAEEMDKLLDVVDVCTVAVDGVLLAATGILSATTGPIGDIVGGIATGGALAATAYYYAELRPTAIKTEEFVKDVGIYLHDVSTDIQKVDLLAETMMNSAINQLPPELQGYARQAQTQADILGAQKMASTMGDVNKAADSVNKISNSIDHVI